MATLVLVKRISYLVTYHPADYGSHFFIGFPSSILVPWVIAKAFIVGKIFQDLSVTLVQLQIVLASYLPAPFDNLPDLFFIYLIT
jgi:hypothetical protein